MKEGESTTSWKERKKEDRIYEILTKEDLLKRQTDLISDVQKVFSLPSAQCRIVLQHFHWDKLKALDKWGENPNSICSAVGLPPLVIFCQLLPTLTF